MISRPVLSALVAFISFTQIASAATTTTTVTAFMTGGFGKAVSAPKLGTGGIPYVAAITVTKPGTIVISATGTWSVNTVCGATCTTGPAGKVYTDTNWQYPLEEAKGIYGTTNMLGALIGAFVPTSRVNAAGFRAVDGTKGIATIGIQPAELFYVGSQTAVAVSQPGTLFLGLNEPDDAVGDDSGSVTVTATGP